MNCKVTIVAEGEYPLAQLPGPLGLALCEEVKRHFEGYGMKESRADIVDVTVDQIRSLSASPTHPVDLLAAAIATQEGFFIEESIPDIRNNPGDLDYAGQIGASLPSSGAPVPRIAIFSSKALGIAALYRQLWLQVAEGQTVRQVITQWDESDPTYLQNVLEWTGLPADTPVLELLPPLTQLNLSQK
jgi:hypothetical protein